jgi:hypothetical protein
MPPRKEPKEAVVYPASKRKAPPFKPLRPSLGTQSTQSKVPAKPIRGRPTTKKIEPRRPSIVISEGDDDDDDLKSLAGDIDENADADEDDASSEGLEEDPLAMKPFTERRQPAPRDESPMAISDDDAPDLSRANASTGVIQASLRTAEAAVPFAIPQPLLIRLLHEAFEDKSTQIDKHAIQVLQKYIEVFMRETIERARLEKQEAVARSGDDVDEDEMEWLDVEDLARVAPAMLCEF